MTARRLQPEAGPDAGLSLVEVLVAVFIMALGSSFILLNLPQRSNPIDTLQAQIAQDVRRVADQAIISGTPHGLRLTKNGYEIVRQQGAEWRAVPRGERDLPPRSELQKVTAGRTEAVTKTLIVVRADRTGVVDGSTLRRRAGTEQRELMIGQNAGLTQAGG